MKKPTSRKQKNQLRKRRITVSRILTVCLLISLAGWAISVLYQDKLDIVIVDDQVTGIHPSNPTEWDYIPKLDETGHPTKVAYFRGLWSIPYYLGLIFGGISLCLLIGYIANIQRVYTIKRNNNTQRATASVSSVRGSR